MTRSVSFILTLCVFLLKIKRGQKMIECKKTYKINKKRDSTYISLGLSVAI